MMSVHHGLCRLIIKKKHTHFDRWTFNSSIPNLKKKQLTKKTNKYKLTQVELGFNYFDFWGTGKIYFVFKIVNLIVNYECTNINEMCIKIYKMVLVDT